MAIRVVNEEPDESVIKNAICKHCGVKVEYLPIDEKEQKMYFMGEYEGYYKYIDCPKCNNRIETKKNKS